MLCACGSGSGCHVVQIRHKSYARLQTPHQREPYFGNRGIYLDKKDFKEFGVVGNYIFIHFINGDYENRGWVEMYEKSYSTLECDREFDYKPFKFTKTYMRKCVTGEIL